MNKYVEIGIGLSIGFLVATAVFVASVYISGDTNTDTLPTTEPTRQISTTTSKADIILVTYLPGAYGEGNFIVYVFHTIQEGSKYTCFVTKEQTINAGSGISCTRDIQAVV